MKTLIVTLLFTAVAFPQEQPQPKTQDPQDRPAQQVQQGRKQGEARRTMLKKLQTDLDVASSRAKFSDEQRKQFDAARQVLRDQHERGRRKNATAETTAANGGTTREALKTLQSLANSEAFQAEDRELLRKDLSELRQSGRNRQGKSGGKARKSAA